MRATVLRKKLHEGLAAVGRNLQGNVTQPVMKNILLDVQEGQIRLAAMDEIRSTEHGVEANISEPGMLCVPGRDLIEIVGALREGDVVLAGGESNKPQPGLWSQLFIGTVGSNFVLNGMDPTLFPDSIPVGEESVIKVPEKDLCSMIHLTSFGAAEDDSRPILQGIYLRAEEGGSLTAAATDTHRLPVAHLGSGAKLFGKPCSFIIPRQTALDVERALSAKGSEPVTIRCDGNQVQFSLGLLRITSRLQEGTFPKFETVIPKDSEIILRLLTNRAAFIEALRRVQLVARKANIGGSTLMILKEHSLVLKSQAADSGKAREEIDAHREMGTELRAAFNAGYLSDAASVLASENIYLELDEAKKAIVRPAGSDESICVIMSQQDLGFEDDQDAEDFRLV
jgi:DNA polymerase III subunit beta